MFSKYQCEFRKGFSAQHCFFAVIGKWQNSMDQGKLFGALLTDLSKAFDCLSHDLLAANYQPIALIITQHHFCLTI